MVRRTACTHFCIGIKGGEILNNTATGDSGVEEVQCVWEGGGASIWDTHTCIMGCIAL